MPNELMFRFDGPLPRGKFEYTCICGKHSIEHIKDDMQTFKCECGAEILVKDQKSHYHIFFTF